MKVEKRRGKLAGVLDKTVQWLACLSGEIYEGIAEFHIVYTDVVQEKYHFFLKFKD